MSLLLFLVVLLGVADQLWAAERCCPKLGCYNNKSPHAIFPLPECPEDMGINMTLYTRKNPKIGQTITRDKIPSSFNGSVMTWFIVHGWLQNQNYTWMHNLKDSALAKGDYNVIIVGWKKGAAHIWYPQSAANTRTVGGEIALVTNNTINNGNSSKASMYCVGHSLGAHVCGHAGQQGQFARITGLDPAGPMFAQCDSSVGLNPSCADFVDVIHTDGMGLGMMKAVGHVDFYPNEGVNQPGCIDESIVRLYNWKNFTILNSNTETSSLQMIIGCSHCRAYEFFNESIGTPCFLSRYSCKSQLQFLGLIFLPVKCLSSNNAVQSMGFSAAGYPARGLFYLNTKPHAPFCL